MMRVVQEYHESHGHKIEVVESSQWVRDLGAIETTRELIEQYPALKLLDFFQTISDKTKKQLKFSTDRAVERSSAMASMSAVNESLMKKWLTGWDGAMTVNGVK